MKVLVVWLLCAVVSATAGSVSWPGATVYTAPTASVLKTVVPAQTKAFEFSTTQYINTVPSGHPLLFQPQVAYQVPQYTAVAPVHAHTFYPVSGATYYPGTVFYPSLPGIAPSFPASPFPGATIIPGHPAYPVQPPQPTQPAQDTPNFPPQTAGDSDTSVVDSADFPEHNNQEQSQQTPSSEPPRQEEPSAQPPQAEAPAFPQPPQGSSELPSFPSLPQFPQGDYPSFPSLPQFPQEIGQAPTFPFPQFPPSYPQFPPSLPQFPQQPSNPNIPQPSPSPPSSFPGGDSGGDKGLNDEDTISVESA